MKKIILAALLGPLLAFLPTNTFAADSSGAAQEWRAIVEPLTPIGERMAEQLSDPQDALLRQELYRSIYAQVAAAYIGLLHADPEHPDFWPGFGQAFNEAFPNPDNVYYMTPLQGDGVYKISGFRGSVRIVDFQINAGQLFPRGTGKLEGTLANYDIDSLHIKKNGSFEVVLSTTRPVGYKGDWWKLDAKATSLMVRQISYDWLHEVDARLAIERPDRPAVKPRASAQQIEANLQGIPLWAENWTKFTLGWIKRVRDRGANRFQVDGFSSTAGFSTQGHSTQVYAEGFFDIAPDEALIVETEMPKQCRYWSFQLTDELWASIDWMNRQSNLNGHTARLDADGKFRAVISTQDPGVPNWLDNAGYTRGLMYGRWNNCSSAPTPTVTKIKVTDVRQYLPADTPTVSAEERDASIRLRRKGAQLRRRW